jgi:hypothetical protein
MKKVTLIRVSIFVALAAVLVLLLALPGSSASAGCGKPALVRFTIVNKSQHPFTIHLYGPETLSFTVAPESKEAHAITRGTYNFNMEACNHSSSGVLNLNMYQTMYVPVCGGTEPKGQNKPHAIDTSDYIKPVRITIHNKTGEKVHLYLRTIENHYYLDLDPWGENSEVQIIVPRDRYVYSFYACGDLEAGYYDARTYIPLDLVCTCDK